VKDIRNPYQIKIEAAIRLAMWHGLSKPLGQVLVSEYPKSGGSWFCQMLGAALDLPFPRNRWPPFGSCVMHGHQLYHPRFGKMIGVVRDGRDVMVSAYFYYLFENERNPSHLVQAFRKALPFSDYSNVEANMPRFILYMFEEYSNGHFHFTWAESVSSFANNKSVKIIKYENLLLDPVLELKEGIDFLGRENPGEEELLEIVDRFSFKKMTQRKPGEEFRNSFLRKGIAGDWKNYFSEEAISVFEGYGGRELERMGYIETKD
jgi:hypothetical protein